MHVHILGVGGTFMGGVAALAQAAGHRVTGSDKPLYPPMSDQLRELGVAVHALDDLKQFSPRPDVVVVGNVMSRGAPAVEFMLDEGLRYTSGPAWLAEHVLFGRHVLAVAGTHGKTTTASLLAWLLDRAGLAPGFLIGGVPKNFGVSARLGQSGFFVVEADEYDTAFFDKRAKFVHYRPRTAVLNNLEYDHADIYPDLAAIQTQFHHLVRTVPGSGRLIVNAADAALAQVLERGAWTGVETFGDGGRWRARAEAGRLRLACDGRVLGEPAWPWPGEHYAANAAAACAAARAAGVADDDIVAALADFEGVRRRAELLGCAGGVNVWDDFAHHPTAIRLTLEGFRARLGSARLLAVVELRSNTMKMGVHDEVLGDAARAADAAWFFGRGPGAAARASITRAGAELFDDHDALLGAVVASARAGDHVVVMSNGGFGGFHGRLLEALKRRAEGQEGG